MEIDAFFYNHKTGYTLIKEIKVNTVTEPVKNRVAEAGLVVGSKFGHAALSAEWAEA